MQSIAEGAGLAESDFEGMTAAVIGAGGVARAIVAGLRSAGAEVTIYNRTLGKAQELARVFDCRAASLSELTDLSAKLIVNCTSVGMYPNVDEAILEDEQITSDMIVFDTVGNPVETHLLRMAGEKGATTIRGIDMLINQAMGQYRLFTGTDADRNVMTEAVSEKI
jgi:3-dehydroquinate dehydratase/shikimate dehydrogenase